MIKTCFNCNKCVYISNGEYACRNTYKTVIKNELEPTDEFKSCEKNNQEETINMAREEKKVKDAIKYRKDINDMRKTMKVGAKIEFCYEKARKQKYYTTGTIVKKYPSVFLVKTDKWNTSLNYNDEFAFK